MGDALDFYKEKYVAYSNEQLDLFRELVEHYAVTSALYPGSRAHVTPSFVIPTVVHVDSDRRAERFFSDPEILDLVRERRDYEGEPTIRFHLDEHASPLDEADQSFDLLISLNAGSASQVYKRYLKVGGYLLVNNGEGDASVATLDPDYALEAVYKRRRGKPFSFITSDLETYMVQNPESPPNPADIQRMMREVGYARLASGAVFKRVR